jgi:hypothetical protein
MLPPYEFAPLPEMIARHKHLVFKGLQSALTFAEDREKKELMLEMRRRV